jgi:hypothetical protein
MLAGMRQVWSLLLAIFHPLGALVRVLEVVLAWLDQLDGIIARHAESPQRDNPVDLRAIEGAIAWGEHWVNLLVGARTAELMGLRGVTGFDTRWSGWQPKRPRAWPDLMRRYERLRLSFAAIERDARRRAARLRRIAAADPLGARPAHADIAMVLHGAVPVIPPTLSATLSLASLGASRGRWIACACTQDGGGARGPPSPVA